MLVVASHPVWAEEATPEPDVKAELAACQKQVKDVEAILVGIAQGVNRELELASYRLQTTKQGKEHK